MFIPTQEAALPRQETQSIWRNRNFVLVLSGYTLSTFGNCFHSVALSLWILQSTGSARYMSAIMLIYIFTQLAFGTLAGTVVDRMDRRKLMWMADFIRGALVLGVALCVSVPHIPIAVVFVLTALIAVGGLFQSPALHASIVDIVGASKVQKAVGFINISDNTARISGLALGGAFVALFGGSVAIIVDACAFFLSALLVLACSRFSVSHSHSGQRERQTFWQDMKSGLHYIWRDSFIRSLVFLSPIVNTFFLASLMLVQVMAVKQWAATPVQFGLIEACIPSGYIIGAGIILLADAKMKRRGLWICFSMIAMSPVLVTLSLLSSAWPAIPLILLMGFLFSFCTMLSSIILRLKVSPEVQGRVFATLGSLSSVLPPVGIVAASFVADLKGPDLPLTASGIALLIISLLFVLFQKALRTFR
ncbi:Enterobactin exporter EntS [Paenibacillus plantiphilus]|uniref:Enterobactin exporter EntS n=1 Tax=Paenibacillus plantiphilus TaxID=2905650 RepID=A0ABN8G601_9BACL|nr:MFS transporter [Paenibacillus plantiphilus]CAH1197665.1 Enterobactin exporter EntS [Paenibacillus plantiphilus]